MDESLQLNQVRRNVVELVSLAVMLVFIAVIYYQWTRDVTEEALHRANDYHFASSVHYLKAIEELRHAQLSINLRLIELESHSDVSTSVVAEQSHYDSNTSFYLILQEVRSALSLQQRFADKRFEKTTSELTEQLAVFEQQGQAYFVEGGVSDKVISNIKNLLLPLQQLNRMHKIVREDLLANLAKREKRHTEVFYIFVFVLLLAGYLIVRRSLTAIDQVIIEIQQNQEALRRKQKMEAIGQLTGGIAHDFNNILGIILGNLGLIETKLEPDSPVKKRFENIEHATKRAIDLTKQLLVFSAGRPTDIKVVDLNDIIKRTRGLIEQSLTPHIEVVQKLDESLWPTVINAGEFEDCLINLALNARDAMDGRGTLVIETHNTTLDDTYTDINPGVEPGDYVQLTVSDNGSGMSGPVQERIFEPFYTTKEQGKGTGLGLSMVFGFVKRSDGHIKVYTEENVGTTFRLYLPRKATVPDDVVYINEHPVAVPHGKGTILIVDDEPQLLEVVEKTLKSNGYDVISAIDGKLALQQLEQHSDIDLLFSDVVMPGGINGFELAEMATKLRPNLKVLLTSGYTDLAIAHNGQARFKTNLLSKPYTRTELLSSVHDMLVANDHS